MDDRIDDILAEAGHDYHEPPATPRDAMWQRIEAARQAERETAARIVATPLAAAPQIPSAPARRSLRPLAWITGMAAMLALGIGIGRSSGAGGGDTPTVATNPPVEQTIPAPRDSEPAIRTAAGDEGQALASAPVPRTRRGRDLAAIPVNAGTRAGASDAAFNVVLGQHLGQSEAFLTLFRTSVHAGRTERVAVTTARQLLSTNRLLLDSRVGNDPRSRQLLQDLELVLAQIAQLRADGDSDDVHLITEDLDQGDVLPRLRTAVPAGI